MTFVQTSSTDPKMTSPSTSRRSPRSWPPPLVHPYVGLDGSTHGATREGGAYAHCGPTATSSIHVAVTTSSPRRAMTVQPGCRFDCSA
jgi:hypothetical protein